MAERLEDILLARGLLSTERVAEALRDWALGGGQLDTVLLELGGLSERALLDALAEAAGVQPLHLGDYEPNAAIAGELPAEVAERLDVVPVSVEGSTLHVASAYPVPQLELEAFGALHHRRLVPWVAITARVRDWLSALYRRPVPAREAAVLAALEPHRPLPLPAEEAAPESGLDEGLTLEELLAREILSAAPEAPPARPAEVAVTRVPAPSRRPAAKTEREFPMLGTSGLFPLAPPAPAPAAPPPEPVVQWTLEEARNALRAVTSDREGIKGVTLRFGRRTFDYVAAFAVVRGKAVGWDAAGAGVERPRLSQLSIPLDVPSLFRTVSLAHAGYAGPVPTDAVSRDILQKLGRRPRTVFLHPVEVKGRLVALVYGDCVGRPVSQRRLADFRLFCQELSGAFAELLVRRRQLSASERAPVASASATPTPVPPPPVLTRPGTAPPTSAAPSAAGPPPDYARLLEQLVGAEPALRARALAALSQTPEASARVLVRAFPGPTGWSRLRVQELPEADELGPIPGALARLGRPGAAALAPLLDGAPDIRYFALLTAGSLPFPELVPGVLRGLFEAEPDLGSAARVAARALRRLPRFQVAMPALRQELAARDALRRVLAARALGALRDRESVEGLVGLTSSDNPFCATAAAEALGEITRASFGTTTRAWVAWWAENRRRSRAQWLLAALRHRELAVRRAAAEELSSALGDSLGYSAEAPEAERETAVQRWEAALPDPRLRALD
jgi:HEAT repeat protein